MLALAQRVDDFLNAPATATLLIAAAHDDLGPATSPGRPPPAPVASAALQELALCRAPRTPPGTGTGTMNATVARA